MANLLRQYMASVKNIPAIFHKIREGTAPDKFTVAHLSGTLGFKGSNDRPIIGILKGLGFLADDGTPTTRYHEYRDSSKSRKVMGSALREAYAELFHINERPVPADRKAIEGKFVSAFNVKPELAERMAATFYSLLELADLDGDPTPPAKRHTHVEKPQAENATTPEVSKVSSIGGLHYNIQIHLPATNDVEVYNAIFKALKEHLVE